MERRGTAQWDTRGRRCRTTCYRYGLYVLPEKKRIAPLSYRELGTLSSVQCTVPNMLLQGTKKQPGFMKAFYSKLISQYIPMRYRLIIFKLYRYICNSCSSYTILFSYCCCISLKHKYFIVLLFLLFYRHLLYIK
jgi:hypothetical protein